MAQLFAPPRFQAVDGNGNPYALAQLFFYQTGTTTLQTVYADSAASVALTNPVVADSNGLFAAIYLANTNLYKAVLKDSAGNTIWTTDPINTTNASASYVPQGRLTLASGTPVMTATQSAATTIYYTPYVGNQCPVYDGTQFTSLTFTELSNATAQSSTGYAGPAAVTTNSNYDLFVWSNGGTPTLTRGPAWTSDTARGTGAGTTELTRINGVLVNAYAITNGPAANRGTYVGTVRSNGSSQIDWIRGAVASNGTAAVLGVWNMYNRVDCRGFIGDSSASWTYTTATWRSAHNSTTMRVSFVCGQTEDFFTSRYVAICTNDTGGVNVSCGIGYDVTNAQSGRFVGSSGPVAQQLNVEGEHTVQALGYHFMQALEISGATGTTTWVGTGAAGTNQSGLTYFGRF